MTDEDWNNGFARCLGLRLAGDAIEEVDARGNRIIDNTLLMLLNAHHEPVNFILPAHRRKVRWEVVFDTEEEKNSTATAAHPGRKPLPAGRSLDGIVATPPPRDPRHPRAGNGAPRIPHRHGTIRGDPIVGP
jgi:pullulanase/glycogen debranching enzyme